LCLCRGRDSVKQSTELISANEGDAAVLRCKYSTVDQSLYLLWYKQQSKASPHGLEFKDRFSAYLDSNSSLVPLTIQNLHISDSTVYHCVFGDKIGPREEDGSIISKETDNVTLKCSYESTSSDILLYWFRQRFNRAPQYLLYRGAKSYSSYKSTPADTRLEATTTDTSTELIISGLKLTDSALYYCALTVDPVIQSP
uniref:Ig-like domain-containing protein n=1 Tax=Pygocentrus nattereri TaxID=42514 RepID=A0AAR2LZ21_PYGNA